MKLTKSKQFLADAIHASGKGWPDGANWAAQDGDGSHAINFFKDRPILRRAIKFWKGVYCDSGVYVTPQNTMPNWHQTILSREEYFSAYPAEPVADTGGWIEWKGGECPVDGDALVVCKVRTGREWRNGRAIKSAILRWQHTGSMTDIIAYRLCKPEVKPELCESVIRSIPEPEAKPTIEQLAQDYRNKLDFANRKQREADDAKAAADAAMGELERAGEAMGLVIGVVKTGPELSITDWRDLRVGDIIECVGSWGKEKTDGMRLPVTALEGDDYDGDLPIRVEVPGISCPGTWGGNFKFIRRP